VYSFVRNFVVPEAFDIMTIAKKDAADTATVVPLLDENERAVLQQERRDKVQPLLAKAARQGRGAALTECNRPGDSTTPVAATVSEDDPYAGRMPSDLPPLKPQASPCTRASCSKDCR
jgi:hypothetical protein